MGWKFWIKEDGKEYDEDKRRSASQRAVLYYLVAVYVGYMGYSILKNRLTGDDTMTYPVAIAVTSVLFIGAFWVVWYATKRMKCEYENSVIETGKNDEEN